MQKNRIRHMFAGGNTSQGFFSYYSYIMSLNNAKKFYILKGGPGTGKSTFIKYIGSEAINNNYNIEYFHCSSDSKSLDGLLIPSLNVAIIDGTSPHAVEPEYPGVVDEIINLGEFWDKNTLIKYRNRVFLERKEIKFNFTRSYRYLKAAALIYEDTAAINRNYLDIRKVNSTIYEIIQEIFNKEHSKEYSKKYKEGSIRKLFASAITPDGVVNYLDSILTTSKIYGLTGEPGIGIDTLLEKIKEEAIIRGFDVECFYCGLIPTKLEHIVIPELDISLTTINKYHNTKLSIEKYINFDEFADNVGKKSYDDVIAENKNQTDLLIERAVKSIVRAKSIHFQMEKYYSPAMDFDKLMSLKENIKDSIFENKF